MFGRKKEPKEVDDSPPEYPADLTEDDAEDITDTTAPIPQEMPAAYAFIKDTLYNTRIPPQISSMFWGVDNIDTRLGNLRDDDEIDIRYGFASVKLAKLQTIRRAKGRVSWEEFEQILQFETVLPAILSRGRQGFERKAEITQVGISLSGAHNVAQDQEKKGLLDAFQKLLE